MQILATNLSSTPLVNFGITYLNLSGNPVTDTYNIPAKPPGSNTGTMVSASQQGSSIVNVSITIVGTNYVVAYGQTLPSTLPVTIGWAQNGDASIVVIMDSFGTGD